MGMRYHLPVLGFCVLVGCLTRPITDLSPTVKTSIEFVNPSRGVDKIDLVLAIDNSGSMGDKQKFLAEAVPELLSRLIAPNCIDQTGKQVVGRASAFEDTDGNGRFGCPVGAMPEFKPIVDIHIGLVSSSLASLSDSSNCKTDMDNGHLLLRAKDAADKARPAPPAESGGYLAWFPSVKANVAKPTPENAYGDLAKLTESFQALVRGVGETGCGLEAQLESVYRFLSQPDPFAEISTDANGVAKFTGVDKTVLKQRAAFLRPDSLVAVVMVTDEDDASFDPMLIGGKGYLYSQAGFSPSRGTSICDTDPGSPDCVPCELAQRDNRYERLRNDKNCMAGNVAPSEDGANVRTFNQKQRFGVDAFYPISRYRAGFASRSVPDRTTDHDGYWYTKKSEAAKCTNPLFARTLPVDYVERTEKGKPVFDAIGADGKPLRHTDGRVATLCDLPRGERDPSNVFFAVVAGVPNELLQKDAGQALLSDTQWQAILGKDPLKYDTTGIDPRMQPSIEKRSGRPAGPADAQNGDAMNTSHRDWDTKGNDLQYACTFALPPTMQKDPPSNADALASFDCKDSSDAPLCSAPVGTRGRKQVRAKAFPGIRELTLARELGEQGIAASICPLDAVNKGPTYGYNPAVAGILDRLTKQLDSQCLPRSLTRDDKGNVQCVMLQVLEEKGQTCASLGLSKPEPAFEQQFRTDKKRTGIELGAGEVCDIPQLAVQEGQGCQEREDAKKGWCYVNAKPQSTCAYAIEFTKDAVQLNSKMFIQCIDQSGGE
jgi:hypothetical protein